jgi:hypothetical protein
MGRHHPATAGDRADGERGQLSCSGRPAPRARSRARRFSALAGCLVLLVLASGCTSPASADLQSAGYQNVTVRPGQSGRSVIVTYSSGPTGNDQRDGQRAVKIVWDTLPGRFASVAIIDEPRRCGGSVCSGYYPEVAGATRAQLAAEYGPRPRGLDRASATGHFALTSGVAILAAGLSVAILAAAAILVTVFVRRRPRRPPAGPAPPAPGPQPSSNWPT